MQTIYALVNDEAYEFLGGKIDLLSAGTIEAKCNDCGIDILHGKSLYDIKSICCSRECAERSGLFNFKGLTMNEQNVVNTMSESVTVESVAPASVVGSTVVNADPQPTVTKTVKANCSECGGLPKGRGWAHTDTCSLSTAFKLAAARGPVRTCPACSGPAKGRGFTHTADCSDVAARVAKAAEKNVGNAPVVEALVDTAN